jgi:hypothetical protein
MLGVMGISGDPKSLSVADRARLADHLRFYKGIQADVMGASASLLTEAKPVTDRSGWSVFQYHARSGRQLVFAFRLQDARAERTYQLVGLPPGTRYAIEAYPKGEKGLVLTEEELSDYGLRIRLAKPASACIVVLSPVQGEVAQ